MIIHTLERRARRRRIGMKVRETFLPEDREIPNVLFFFFL
jgi:hypothetical protein